MKVSMLIHNLNRAHLLGNCLSSIAEQIYRPLEVVLLDAGSTDDSKAVINKYANLMQQKGIKIKCIDCSSMGVAASRNFASKHASGDLLCAIDNDAYFDDPEGLNSAVKLFQMKESLAVVSFRILLGKSAKTDPFTWVYRRSLQEWSERQFKTFTFTGGGFCIRADAFRKVGGFWDHLEYSREEEELAIALLDKGWEILYSPDIVIRHFADPRGRANIYQRRYVELRNGLWIFWRRFPLLFAIIASCGRISSMFLKMALKEKKSPSILLGAIIQAIQEWRRNQLKRLPVSNHSVWKYVLLHFAR